MLSLSTHYPDLCQRFFGDADVRLTGEVVDMIEGAARAGDRRDGVAYDILRLAHHLVAAPGDTGVMALFVRTVVRPVPRVLRATFTSEGVIISEVKDDEKTREEAGIPLPTRSQLFLPVDRLPGL